jgi:hypothetical protein
MIEKNGYMGASLDIPRFPPSWQRPDWDKDKSKENDEKGFHSFYPDVILNGASAIVRALSSMSRTTPSMPTRPMETGLFRETELTEKDILMENQAVPNVNNFVLPLINDPPKSGAYLFDY